MTNRSTDRLIHRLATEGGRVRRITSPIRASIPIVGSTALIGAAFLGPSAVVHGAWHAGTHSGIESVAFLGLVIAAAGGIAASLAEREPGRQTQAMVGVVALATGLALAVGAAFAATWITPSSVGSWGDQLRCLAKCCLLALPATTLSLLILGRSAPGRPRLAVISAGAGAAALGAVIVHLACSGAGEPHLLAAQGLAPLLGAALALPFARGLVRWSRASQGE